MGLLARRGTIGQECPTCGFTSDEALPSPRSRVCWFLDAANAQANRKKRLMVAFGAPVHVEIAFARK